MQAKVSGRDLRRILQQQERQIAALGSAIGTDFEQVGHHLQKTREVVADVAAQGQRIQADVLAFTSRSAWARFRWLVLGR